MQTARVKTSRPAASCCAYHGAEMSCSEGRACPARTTNGGQRIDTTRGTADELPVVLLDTEPPRLGSAVAWFAIAALATTAAAWLGLLAGLWSATP